MPKENSANTLIYLNETFMLNVHLKWCIDITYIPTKEGFVSLSVIKDLYDNFTVAYKVVTENNNNLVYETAKAAKGEVTAELQFHSDQGFQYASAGYFKLTLRAYSVKNKTDTV